MNDILVTSYSEDAIYWFENLVLQFSSIPLTISASADGSDQAIAVDIDGDLDLDVVSASRLFGPGLVREPWTAWGPAQVVSTLPTTARWQRI
ncbi:MAG: VCBS repeat-containing protein [Flavobacteriaceae bacterium]